MKKHYKSITLTLCFIFIFTSFTSAQIQEGIQRGGLSNIYIGFEAGPTGSLFTIYEVGNHSQTGLLISTFYAFSLGHNLSPYLRLETGAYRNSYVANLEYTDFSILGSFNLFNTIGIPLRLKSTIPLKKNFLYFTPSIGYTLNITTNNKIDVPDLDFTFFPEAFTFTFNAPDLPATFSLLETGLGLEMNVYRNIRLLLNAAYFTGFKNIADVHLQYSIFGDDPENIIILSKAEFFTLTAGLKVPLKLGDRTNRLNFPAFLIKE